MHKVTYNDPLEETQNRVAEYVKENRGTDLKTAYAAVLKADPEMKRCHDLAMLDIIEAGGRLERHSDPMMEFDHKMKA